MDDNDADEAGDGRIGRWRKEMSSPWCCVLCRWGSSLLRVLSARTVLTQDVDHGRYVGVRPRLLDHRVLTYTIQTWSDTRCQYRYIGILLGQEIHGGSAPDWFARPRVLPPLWGSSLTVEGWHLLGVGAAGFFFVPSARVWGKRHLYILGTVLLVVSSIWGGAAKSYNSLLWARVIQGVAVAPFEALVNASIGDM